MPDQLAKYYEYLKSNGADVAPSLESFKSTLSNEKTAKQYYSYLRDNQFDAPDTFDSFVNTFGLKKKEPTPSVYSNTQLPLPSRVPKETSPVLTDLSFKNINQSLPSGGAAVKDVSEIDNIASSIKKGQLQGKIANTLPIGRVPNVDELGKVAEYQKELQSIPASENEQAFQNEGFAIFKNPLRGAKFLTETIASSLSSLFESGKRTVPAAVGIGAVAGAPFAGIGAAAGAAAGLTSGLTTAGVNLSTSGKILELLQSEGVYITDKDSLVKAFSDENKMAKLRSKANKYAIPIAVFDVASAGIGGKLIGGAAGKTIAKKALAGLGEAGIQAVMGSGGELSGQLASGQKVDWNEVALEGISSLATDAPDVAIGAIRERAKASSNNKTIARQVVTLGKEAGVEDATHNLNRDLANGIISEEEHAQGIEFAQKAAEVAAKIPDDVAPENKAKSIELIVGREEAKAEIEQLEAEKKTLDEAYHAELDEAIKAKKEAVESINKEVAELSKEKVKPEIEEEPLVTEAEIKTPQVEEQAIEILNPTEVEKPTTETVSEVKPTTEEREIKISDILEENSDNQKLSDAIINVQDGLGSKTDGNILVKEKNGKYEVGDGFHRVAEAILRGDKTIKAEVEQPKIETPIKEEVKVGTPKRTNIVDLNEESTPLKIDEINEDFVIHRGSEQGSNTGFHALDESGAGGYGSTIVSSKIKKGAKILKLVEGDTENYKDNPKDIEEFYKILGDKEKNKGSEWASGEALADITTRLWNNKSAINKLKKAGVDIVVGETIDGVAVVVINKDAVETVNTIKQKPKEQPKTPQEEYREFMENLEQEKQTPKEQVKPIESKPTKEGELSFLTHNKEVVTGKKLTDALNAVADKMVESAKKKRKEHYASHVTEAQKDAILEKDIERAEEVRKGENIDNFTIWQRINTELTGETPPLLPKVEPKSKSEGEVIKETSTGTSVEENGKENTQSVADQYEAIKEIKSKKAQEKAKEKLINDNFESIVSQLMLKNKIKRIC